MCELLNTLDAPYYIERGAGRRPRSPDAAGPDRRVHGPSQARLQFRGNPFACPLIQLVRADSSTRFVETQMPAAFSRARVPQEGSCKIARHPSCHKRRRRGLILLGKLAARMFVGKVPHVTAFPVAPMRRGACEIILSSRRNRFALRRAGGYHIVLMNSAA